MAYLKSMVPIKSYFIDQLKSLIILKKINFTSTTQTIYIFVEIDYQLLESASRIDIRI